MTYDIFLVTHPEFRTAGEPLVREFLNQASKRLSASVLGEVYDEAHGCLTAHMICSSPGAQMSRLVAKDGSTCYSKQLEAIKLAVVPGVSLS